jgi:hypothetical protein
MAVLKEAYFIAHRYEGGQLWRLLGVPPAPTPRFGLTLFCLLPLCPATFNLLEARRGVGRVCDADDWGSAARCRQPRCWMIIDGYATEESGQYAAVWSQRALS